MSNRIASYRPLPLVPQLQQEQAKASESAESQTFIQDRKRSPSAFAAFVTLQTTPRKKAEPKNFAPPKQETEVTDERVENSEEPTAKMQFFKPAEEKGNSDVPSDKHDDTQFVYQRKLDELDQICVPGMSTADAARAKELAMQAILCANLATMAGKKSTRGLSEVVGQMVQKLKQAGVSLPTDTESLLGLLKAQSANLPSFLRTRLEDKNSMVGHLLPLALFQIRQQSQAIPPSTRTYPSMAYGRAA